NETLVLGEILDRKVTLAATGEQVTVVDAGMEQDRTRDWEITELFVRKSGGGFRRRGETLIADWDEVTGLAQAESNQGTAALLATYEKMRAADLAGVLHDLSAKRRAEVAAALDDEKLADVLEEMSED